MLFHELPRMYNLSIENINCLWALVSYNVVRNYKAAKFEWTMVEFLQEN